MTSAKNRTFSLYVIIIALWVFLSVFTFFRALKLKVNFLRVWTDTTKTSNSVLISGWAQISSRTKFYCKENLLMGF